MTKWSAYKKSKITGSVHTLILITQHKEILKNQNYVKCIIVIILFLSHQRIAFRSHQDQVIHLIKV